MTELSSWELDRQETIALLKEHIFHDDPESEVSALVEVLAYRIAATPEEERFLLVCLAFKQLSENLVSLLEKGDVS